MATIKIFCPACGSVLKLPDRRFLGKKARCGKCSRAFVAYEPDPADFPQEENPPGNAVLPGSGGAEPDVELVGVAARWIPDATPDQEVAANAPRAFGQASLVSEQRGPSISLPVEDTEPKLAALVRRRKKGWLNFAVTAGCFAAVLIAGWFLFKDQLTARPAKTGTAGEKPGSRFDKIFGKKDPTSDTGTEAIVSPTHGKPISLKYVPDGARVLINLHPAALWTNGGRMEEFRACCGPLAAWLEEQLKTLCLEEPSKIEEVLIAFIPSEKGQPPDVSAVVHLSKPLKRSLLLQRFKGRSQQDNPRHTYYLDGQHIYLVVDDRTYAIGPRLLEKEFLLAADNVMHPVESLDKLLQRSDRDRHLTIAFEPVAVQLDAPFLAPASAQPLLQGVLDWFGNDVVGVVWSLHLAPHFHSEILLRNKTDKSPERLHRQFYKKLDGLPRDILAQVEPLKPATMGTRRVVGRFPAMTSAFALSTRMDHDDRLVAFHTELPERAAPNLAIGARLTWDEIVRAKMDLQTNDKVQGPATPAKPATLAERLAKRIDVDFRNDALYKALDDVGEMTGIKFKIEGNDLKMVGITQNMKQLFKLDNVPATAVLHRMLDGIKLVIVLDEAKDLVIVTSSKAAEEKRLKVFPLAPAASAKP